jgi:hypothetical protein
MTNVRNMPVMAERCMTCPFNTGGDPSIRAKVEERCVAHASQICHHLNGSASLSGCQPLYSFWMVLPTWPMPFWHVG